LEAERRAFRQAVAMAGLDPEAVADLLQIDLDYAKKRLKEWFPVWAVIDLLVFFRPML